MSEQSYSHTENARNGAHLRATLGDAQHRESVGEQLREAREAQGLDLRQVAGMLRIRAPHLQSIENGRYGDLPGSAYAIGFIRSYADFLGLDAEEMVRRFKQESTTARARPDLQVPRPVSESNMPGGALILFCAVLVAAVYGVWYYMSSEGRSVADMVPELPARFASVLGLEAVEEAPVEVAAAPAVTSTDEPAAPPAAAPVSAASPEPVEPAASVTVIEPAEPTEVTVVSSAPAIVVADPAPDAGTAGAAAAPAAEPPPEPEVVSSVESQVVSTAEPAVTVTEPAPVAVEPDPPAQEAAASAAEPPATGRTYGASSANSAIVIRFTQDSWVEVRDARGNLQMARMLKPGDTYFAPSASGLRMKAGNAGGLEITVNGEPVPSVGGPGDVRNFALDAQRLTSGTAVLN